MAGNEGIVGILRAILTADATSFVAEMKKAATAPKAVEKAVTGLGDEVKKLTPQAERMVKAFGGDKLLYTANSLTAAVQKLGGAQKLTEAEQARVNRTLTEAIAKYALLGRTAPDAMIALEKATRKTEQSTVGFGGTVRTLGTDILAMAAGFFTAQAAFSAIKFGIGALASEIQTLVMHGSAVSDVSDNFERLTRQAGQTGATLLGALREGTHATISDFELMKTITGNLAANLRLTEAQYKSLAAGAFALAQATGGDVKTALDAMNDAMLTGRTRALALLTGKINETAAEEKFAARLGVTADKLTDAGKLEAKRIAILEAVAAATTRLGDQVDGLDERVAQGQATWANFNDELGKTVANSPVLGAAFDGLKDSLTSAFGAKQDDLVKTLAREIDTLAISMVDVATTGVEAGGFLAKEFIAVKKIFEDLAQIVDGNAIAFKYLALAAAKGLNGATAGGAMKGDIARINTEIDGLLARMSERGAALQRDSRAQIEVDDVTKKFAATLAAVRDRMAAAQKATLDHAAATKTLGTVTAAAAGGIGATGEAFVEASQDALKFRGHLKDVAADVARGLTTLNDDEFLKEFGPKLEDIAREMEKFGITGTQVPDAIGKAFDRLVTIEFAKVSEAVAKIVFEQDKAIKKTASELAQHTGSVQLANIRGTYEANLDAARTSNTIDQQRAEFSIGQAERSGVAWQRLAAMDVQLSRMRLRAAIDAEAAEYAVRVAGLDTATSEYAALEAAHNLRVQQMTEAVLQAEATKRDELRHTYDVWVRLQDNLRALQAQSVRAVSDGFADMLVGARSFKDAMLDIWRSIQRGISNILSDILNEYLGRFVKGLISGSSAGGGGSVTGSLAQTAGGAVLTKALGIGGGAAAAAGGATLVGGGAAAAGEFAVTTGAVSAGLVGGSVAGTTAGGAAAGGAAAGGGLGASIAGLATNPITIAVAAGLLLTWGIAKKGWFRGGQEALQVNPKRDAFLGQFGGVSALGARLLASFMKHGLTYPAAERQRSALIDGQLLAAHDMKHFQSAEKSIATALGGNVKMFNLGGFVAPGAVVPAVLHGGGMGELAGPMDTMVKMIADRQRATGGGRDVVVEVHNHISAIDASGVKEFVESPNFINSFVGAVRNNRHFLTSNMQRVMA